MFTIKTLKVQVSLLGEDFTEQGTITFNNLPVQAQITKVGLPSGNKAVLKIYGVSKEHMDRITVVKLKQAIISNRKVRLFANDGDGEKLVYEGYIISSVPVYDSAPNVYIRIESSVGAFPNAKVISSSDFSENAPVFQGVKKLCNQYGYDCIKGDKGVEDDYYGKVPSNMVYDQEGLYARLNEVQRDFKLDIIYKNSQYVVYKKGEVSARKFYLNPSNYIGYPSFDGVGITVKTENVSNFSGNVNGIDVNDLMIIDGSEVGFANGSWQVYKIEYNLQSKMPNGKWEMSLSGVYYTEKGEDGNN